MGKLSTKKRHTKKILINNQDSFQMMTKMPLNFYGRRSVSYLGYSAPETQRKVGDCVYVQKGNDELKIVQIYKITVSNLLQPLIKGFEFLVPYNSQYQLEFKMDHDELIFTESLIEFTHEEIKDIDCKVISKDLFFGKYRKNGMATVGVPGKAGTKRVFYCEKKLVSKETREIQQVSWGSTKLFKEDEKIRDILQADMKEKKSNSDIMVSEDDLLQNKTGLRRSIRKSPNVEIKVKKINKSTTINPTSTSTPTKVGSSILKTNTPSRSSRKQSSSITAEPKLSPAIRDSNLSTPKTTKKRKIEEMESKASQSSANTSIRLTRSQKKEQESANLNVLQEKKTESPRLTRSLKKSANVNKSIGSDTEEDDILLTKNTPTSTTKKRSLPKAKGRRSVLDDNVHLISSMDSDHNNNEDDKSALNNSCPENASDEISTLKIDCDTPSKSSRAKTTRNRTPKSKSKSGVAKVSEVFLSEEDFGLIEPDENEDSMDSDFDDKENHHAPEAQSEEELEISSEEIESDHSEVVEKKRKRTKYSKIRKAKVNPKHKRWALLSLAKKLEKPIEFEGKDKFEKASLRLHVSAVPDVLPCRDDEYTEMFGHIASALEEGSGSCIYVSGVPGTGKTATFRAVLRELRSLLENQELPDFDFVEINGMKLSEPKQAYSSLWNGLTGNKVTPAHAEQLLVSRFNEKQSDRKPCIVLMDELDLLVNKKQTVVYNFFDWPNLPHSKLIVVAVANTMDLPERMLSNKVSSRLGLTRMTFQPYNHAQLMEIIQSRLTGLGIFGSKAIEFCARRISGVSGDARRCLDVCRRAVEIFQNSNDNSDELIGMKHIDSAIKEMNSSPIVKAIQYSSFHQQLFLIACIKQIRKKGTTELDYGSVIEEHEYITRSNHIECPTHSSLHSICTFLAQYQLIMIQTHLIGDPVMKLKLIVNEQDVFLGIRLCKNQMLMKLIERIDR